MPKLTADTITDDQIRSLQSGARSAGNDLLVDCCTVALMWRGGRSMRARGECADAINAANLALAGGK